MKYLIEEVMSISYLVIVEADSEEEAEEKVSEIPYSERLECENTYISCSSRLVEPGENTEFIPVFD